MTSDPKDPSRAYSDIIGQLAEIERRLWIALTGSISAIVSVRSPSAPRDRVTVAGSSDPLLDSAITADQLTSRALDRLHHLDPAQPPPPAASQSRAAAAWVRTTIAALHVTVNDLHNDWWLAHPGDRPAYAMALRVLDDETRGLRNQLEWTGANRPAPARNVNANRRCTDPLERGCQRIVRDADGDRRRICGACRTRQSRERNAS